MRRGASSSKAFLIGGIIYALGILSAILLPNILIVIILTALLLLFCITLIR